MPGSCREDRELHTGTNQCFHMYSSSRSMIHPHSPTTSAPICIGPQSRVGPGHKHSNLAGTTGASPKRSDSLLDGNPGVEHTPICGSNTNRRDLLAIVTHSSNYAAVDAAAASARGALPVLALSALPVIADLLEFYQLCAKSRRRCPT